ncbi:MAG: succinate dehydrogenase, hydrophobic membrane anchor protein [Gammaproteobacteria bacterium]|nr:succinate dehydrogenase, hydrophobic membrane anchor protein [Gammaproteobacteria bacterium]
MNLRTPLSQVKGLGAAKEGVSHWWMQRLTSIALVPLVLWLGFGLASLSGADYATFTEWVRSPMVAVLLILTIVVSFHHGQMGLQVIVEDYVPNEPVRAAAIILVKLAAVLFSVIGVYAVLKIALGAG